MLPVKRDNFLVKFGVWFLAWPSVEFKWASQCKCAEPRWWGSGRRCRSERLRVLTLCLAQPTSSQSRLPWRVRFPCQRAWGTAHPGLQPVARGASPAALFSGFAVAATTEPGSSGLLTSRFSEPTNPKDAEWTDAEVKMSSAGRLATDGLWKLFFFENKLQASTEGLPAMTGGFLLQISRTKVLGPASAARWYR